MTSLLQRSTFPIGLPADRLERKLVLARFVVMLERVVPRLWPSSGFVCLYLALALFGLFAFVPWPVESLLLACTISATGISLAQAFEDFRWPQAIEGARRLERDSGLAHRPISERNDVLAIDDPFARQLWALHQARSVPGKLRVTGPHTDLSRRDPHGLRWYLLILIALAVLVARTQSWPRLMSAFDSGAGAMTSIDAWIDPPPYTAQPLLSLRTGDRSLIGVPQGSVLNLRVHGAPRTPGLTAGGNAVPGFKGQDGEYSSNIIISRDARVRVQVGGHAIAKWNIHAVPDTPPVIDFTQAPARTEQLATKFAFKARDDYGVTSVQAILVPHGRRPAKAVALDLALPQVPSKSVNQNSYVDLTGHPYAGLLVDVHLQARDAIGQKGQSRSVTFRLPARVFTDPLARALVEQRQQLAMSDSAGRHIVLVTLDALAIDPERFYDGKHDIYLALRDAYYGLKNARTEADIARVEDLLWQTALKLERGGLLSAAEELRKLQQMLSAAMAANAPQDVIDELLNRYNQAMQRYLDAMAANPPPQSQQPLSKDAKTLSMKDIDTLMQMIQKLSQAGDREQAAQLLSMLQSMLENLHMTVSSGGGGQQNAKNKALGEQIQKFGSLMGKQRALLDKTFRQSQGQGDPKDGGPQGLSKQQGDLQKQLGDAMKGLDPNSADKLRQAGKAMGEAQGALSRRDLANAGRAQNQALEALRQGAQALAQKAEQGDQGDREDPLGRGTSILSNSQLKLPRANELARARAILQELRRRASEMNRPQQERDYLDRLLKAF